MQTNFSPPPTQEQIDKLKPIISKLKDGNPHLIACGYLFSDGTLAPFIGPTEIDKEKTAEAVFEVLKHTESFSDQSNHILQSLLLKTSDGWIFLAPAASGIFLSLTNNLTPDELVSFFG